VEGDRELAGAEVRAEVAADLPDRVDDQLTDLLGDLGQLRVGQTPEVVGVVDRLQQARPPAWSAPVRPITWVAAAAR